MDADRNTAAGTFQLCWSCRPTGSVGSSSHLDSR